MIAVIQDTDVVGIDAHSRRELGAESLREAGNRVELG